ncbi:hypothetical protein [Asaia astilbis]|uniref:hypothetical protein n=1 Tax=Asaia astilbis TaxID=610244 RepID=UPI000AF5F37A|nr:hypothetical protein [Asaia astilbis]
MSSPSLSELPTRRQAFSVVFAIELWERFGYYGMQAVLTLYLVQRLGLSDVAANVMIAAFVGLTYITPVLVDMRATVFWVPAAPCSWEPLR